jgi:hypothetical protein
MPLTVVCTVDETGTKNKGCVVEMGSRKKLIMEQADYRVVVLKLSSSIKMSRVRFFARALSCSL